MERIATRIEQIIADAARSGGAVHVRVGNGTPVALLWLEGPTLVAAAAEGTDHRVAARLISTGHMASSEIDRVRSAAARRSVSLAAALGNRVRRDVVEALVRDEARYALAAALAAPAGEIETGPSAPEGQFTFSIDAGDLLTETYDFLAAVREAQARAPSSAMPIAAEAPSPDLSLSPEEWALLSRADGTASIAQLAHECGFPQPEASLIVTRLAAMGLLSIEAGLAGASELMAELEAAEDLAAITAAFEHAATPATEQILSDTAMLHPIEAPAEDPQTAATPAADSAPLPTDIVRNGDRSVDTQALLRELSSIARAPERDR